MCGTAMRGADALPGSKATSRAKGSYRNLGDLGSDRNGVAVAGPHREGEEPKPMMNGPEKLDPGIVLLSQKVAAKGEKNHLFGKIHTSAMGRLKWVCQD